MWVQERSTAMENAQACVRYMEWTHEKNDCDAKYETKPWQDCTLLDGAGKKFGKRHHSLLHGSNHVYICNMLIGANRRIDGANDCDVLEVTDESDGDQALLA